MEDAILTPSQSGRDSSMRRSRLGIGRDAKASMMLSRMVELDERVRITREGVGLERVVDKNLDSR